MEPYKPRDAAKRIYAVSFPMPFWVKIQEAATKKRVSAAEWIRQACYEKAGGIMTLAYGWDAEFCPAPPPKDIGGLEMSYAGFYLGGSSAARAWTFDERRRLAESGLKCMPIWVPTPGSDNPRQVALLAAASLRAVSVPDHATPWRILMWDMETGVEPDSAWLNIAADTLASRGYGSLVYGSVDGSGLFSYPARSGYMVAHYDERPTPYPHVYAVGKQYQASVPVPGGVVDLDVIEASVLTHLGSVA